MFIIVYPHQVALNLYECLSSIGHEQDFGNQTVADLHLKRYCRSQTTGYQHSGENLLCRTKNDLGLEQHEDDS